MYKISAFPDSLSFLIFFIFSIFYLFLFFNFSLLFFLFFIYSNCCIRFRLFSNISTLYFFYYYFLSILLYFFIYLFFLFFCSSERVIYNVTSSAEYKLTFEELVDIGRETVYNKIPLNGVFWYPGGSMKRSRLHHNLAFFFYQWLPAVLVDILLVCLGYKPVLKRVQRRILKGYEVFEYYANRQWDFHNDGSLAARKLMTERERELYKVQYFCLLILS